MAPAAPAAPAPAEAPQELISSRGSPGSPRPPFAPRPVSATGRFFFAPAPSGPSAAVRLSPREEARHGRSGILVRVRQHLFLSRPRCGSGRSPRRGASTLTWRPFLLGPIFAAQGWRNSPFNIYPAKGRYMWRDLERICAAAGLPFRRPEPFPQTACSRRGSRSRCKARRAQNSPARFSQRNSAKACRSPTANVIARLIDELGLDPEPVARRGRERRQQGAAQGRMRPRARDSAFSARRAS